ncbi:MAG: transcriptional regulator [Candidatus Odinarchaeota archaeon]
MNKKCRSIYQLARNYADLTQEEAASLLSVGVRTLGGYEACNPIPQKDIVERMIEIYKTEWLGYMHLSSSDLGTKYLPQVMINDFAESVLIFQDKLNDAQNLNKNIIEVAVKKDEDTWNDVSEKLLEMAGAALTVIFSKNATTKKRPSQMVV